jgi:hypothetical protein
MTEITDDYMTEQLSRSRLYTAVLLQRGPEYESQSTRSPEKAALVWAHGRRNFQLRAEGIIALVGPGSEDGPFLGLVIFNLPADAARESIEKDPAVAAGFFSYQIGPWRSFPGDTLP